MAALHVKKKSFLSTDRFFKSESAQSLNRRNRGYKKNHFQLASCLPCLDVEHGLVLFLRRYFLKKANFSISGVFIRESKNNIYNIYLIFRKPIVYLKVLLLCSYKLNILSKRRCSNN